MKQQLRIGSNPIVISGQSFGRAYLLVQGVGASTLVNTDFVLPNLRTQIEICQAGIKDTTAFNGVGPFIRGLLESQKPSTWTDSGLANNGQSLRGVLIDGSTTACTFQIPLLENGYILKGDDYISFNIDILPAFYTANTTAGSSIYLITEEANGIVQTDVNMPVYEPITTDKQSPAFTYDACSEIYLINAVNNYTLATDPFQSIDVRTQYVAERFDQQTLTARRYFNENITAVQGCSKVFAVEPSALWDVQVGIAVNTSLVTAGSQFLYISKVLTSPQLVRRAVAHQQKVVKTNLKYRGVKN